MTDASDTPAAEPVVGQDAAPVAPAVETLAEPDTPPEAPEGAVEASVPEEVQSGPDTPAEEEFLGEEFVPEEAPQPVNLNALRGVPAGPDHTRHSQHSAHLKA